MEFSPQKHIHMYNHLMICTDNENVYEAICESAPTKEPTLLFWLDDFKLPDNRRETFIEELENWCSTHEYLCTIYDGKGR